MNILEELSLTQPLRPLNQQAMEAARRRWNSIAKPLHSLGLLEDDLVRMAGILDSADVNLSRRAVVVMCADNGVVAEGVTQTGQEVTAIVAENIAKGDASVCRMAHLAHASVYPVDIGVARPLAWETIIQACVRRGTRNMVLENPMTKAETLAAIRTGVEIAGRLKQDGFRLIATGEMGIGNTTTSSALASVLMGLPVETVTGRGAGLSDEGLARKQNAIRKAILRSKPSPDDPLGALEKLGGLDIAGLAGLCIGGAVWRVPILLDGFISAAAALCAVRMLPETADFLFASHVSKEPAAHLILKELGLCPLITANMALGEGTGAVAAMPLLDMGLAVYDEMRTFEEIDVEAYKPL